MEKKKNGFTDKEAKAIEEEARAQQDLVNFKNRMEFFLQKQRESLLRFQTSPFGKSKLKN